MSIYPVRLAEWFPRSSEMYETARMVVKYKHCNACAKPLRYSKAWGHHSIPWGYGELWCGLKCLNSRKTKYPKPDKRFNRRLKRSGLLIDIIQEADK